MEQMEIIGAKPNALLLPKIISEKYVAEVAEVVCKNMRLSIDVVRAKGRTRELVKARSIITKICKDAESDNQKNYADAYNKGWTLIGSFLGYDHSCAIYWNRIANQDMADPDFKAKYYECLNDLNLLKKSNENNSKNRKSSC